MDLEERGYIMFRKEAPAVVFFNVISGLSLLLSSENFQVQQTEMPAKIKDLYRTGQSCLKIGQIEENFHFLLVLPFFFFFWNLFDTEAPPSLLQQPGNLYFSPVDRGLQVRSDVCLFIRVF